MQTLERNIVQPESWILDPSLVLYLPLYELDGASIMSRDAYGHLCTVTGALWRPDGRSFDGSDDDINLGDVAQLDFAGDSSFSIFGWWKTPAPFVGYAPILVSKFDNQNDKGWLLIAHSTRGLEFSLNGVSTGVATNAAFTGADTWTFFGGIKDSTNALKLIINGVEPSYTLQENGININSPTGTDCLVGDRGDEPNGPYVVNGLIGEVLFYNRALTPFESQYIYIATKWRYV